MKCVASVALIACAPALAFAVDPAFPPSERGEIAQAAATWNTVTVQDKQIVVDGGEWTIQRAAPDGGWNGITYAALRLIYIHPKHPGATAYAVALHEFGHALGLQHLCASDAVGDVASNVPCDPSVSLGVMDPTHVEDELSTADMAECRRVEACK